LKGTAASVKAIVLPGQISGQDVSDWLDERPKAGQTEFLAAVAAAAELSQRGWKPEEQNASASPDPAEPLEPPKPDLTTQKGASPRIINFGPGLVTTACKEAEEALKTSKRPLFQRSGKIVEPAFIKGKSFDDREVLNPAIVKVPPARLLRYVDEVATVRRTDRTRALNTLPPPELIQSLIQLESELTLPVLRGMIHVPIVPPTGRVIDRPGYDERAGIFYNPLGQTFPPLPSAPTKTDALAAIETMWKPFRCYKFKNQSLGRATVLALLMTVLIRVGFSCVPIFAVSSPQYGSGKGKLLSAISKIAMGEAPILITQGANPEEEEKRLDSAVMGGAQLVVIDNVD
jgi:hypothetical protein